MILNIVPLMFICNKIFMIKLKSSSMAEWVWRFETGDTKLERFLLKNQHTQRKLLNFEFWINGELSKSAKI